MRLLCALVKLFTHRAGKRREQFSNLLGGDE